MSKGQDMAVGHHFRPSQQDKCVISNVAGACTARNVTSLCKGPSGDKQADISCSLRRQQDSSIGFQLYKCDRFRMIPQYKNAFLQNNRRHHLAK